MNEFFQPVVNYYAIIDALASASLKAWEKNKDNFALQPNWAVAEYKTIGFSVARQCGGTYAIHQWINRHPGQCLLFCKDKMLYTAGVQKYLKCLAGAKESDYTGVIPGRERMYFQNSEKCLTEELKSSTRYVIVDDASVVFNLGLLKRSEFNKWVAENFHPDTLVILIK